MLEIVNDALSVEKVHGGAEEIPVQGSGEGQILRSAGDVGDGYDFLEGDDLDSGNYADDVNVAGEHGCKETSYHDERPYCSSDEGLLLFFVLGLRFWLFLYGRWMHGQLYRSSKKLFANSKRMSSFLGSDRDKSTSSLLTSLFPFINLGPGLLGSETPSLVSEILGLLP